MQSADYVVARRRGNGCRPGPDAAWAARVHTPQCEGCLLLKQTSSAAGHGSRSFTRNCMLNIPTRPGRPLEHRRGPRYTPAPWTHGHPIQASNTEGSGQWAVSESDW